MARSFLLHVPISLWNTSKQQEKNILIRNRPVEVCIAMITYKCELVYSEQDIELGNCFTAGDLHSVKLMDSQFTE